MFPIPQDPVVLIVFLLLLAALVLQLYYYLFTLSSVGFSKVKEVHNESSPAISVVICARSELKNLRMFLPGILDQDYPEYQVVVVNDCSWDESGKLLEELAATHPRLKVITLENQEKYQHGKKFALAIGIKGAEHEHLLLTDADCRPVGRNWIRKMSEGFMNNKSLVISYGAYEREAGLLNKWIRFETAMSGLMFLGRAMRGKAYMGVGRNLAYTKSLFFKNKGFANHYHILSGDDDLFVNEVATPVNTAVVLHPEAFTVSNPKSTFSGWINQRVRHLSAGKYYKSSDKTYLGIWHSSHLLFWISTILAFALKLNWHIIVTILTLRFIVQMIICWKGFKALGERDLLPFIILFDILSAFIQPFLAVSGLFYRNQHWK